MNYSSHIYYDPPLQPPDGPDGTLIFILLFAGLIAALIWLINWEPEEEKKKNDKKTIRQEIDKIFGDLRTNAVLYNRPEFVPSLITAQEKVVEVLDKHNVKS